MREIMVEECECVRRNSAKGDKTAVKSDEYEWLRVQAGNTHVISPRGSRRLQAITQYVPPPGGSSASTGGVGSCAVLLKKGMKASI